MNKYKLILATSLMLVPTINLHAESVQKNYVNWCSDPGSGGCPVARVPYMTPKSNQLTPHPIPQLVPHMLPVLEPRQYMGVPKLQQAPDQIQQHVPQQVLPVQKTPNLIVVPVNNQLIPQPIEQKVPTQVLPEQKIPGFAKTIGRPGEVNLENKPKEIKQVKIKNNVKELDNKIKKTRAKLKALKQVERLVDVTNKIQARIENESNSVRGVQYKANNFDYVLGGLAVATSLVVKRRNNGKI